MDSWFFLSSPVCSLRISSFPEQERKLPEENVHCPISSSADITESRGRRLSGKSSYFWHRGNLRWMYRDCGFYLRALTIPNKDRRLADHVDSPLSSRRARRSRPTKYAPYQVPNRQRFTRCQSNSK